MRQDWNQACQGCPMSLGSVKEQARRVYELELENARLKRLVAELRLDKAISKGLG